MAVRHPTLPMRLPTLWLMTDERMGDGLWAALAGLPRGSGVVFRHFATERRARATLGKGVLQVAHRRGLVFVEGGATEQSVTIRAAHSIREAIAAHRTKADLIFVSPVHPTRTHPGARALGVLRAARIARSVPIPAIALGGMTRMRFMRLRALGFVGWAAIDGLTPRGAVRKA